MAELEKAVLGRLHEAGGEIADSDHLAKQLQLEHAALVGTIKSLASHEMINAEVHLNCDSCNSCSK